VLVFVLLTSLGFTQQPSKDELLGKFEPASHPDFALVDQAHANRSGLFLRKETLASFIAMKLAADSANVKLVIISATRNHSYQKGIWEKKWKREKYAGWSDLNKAKDILTYSSMPGTSRHHWGTDLDMNSLEPGYFRTGDGKKTYDWLVSNAARFGFCQTYTNKSKGRTGYSEEAWHWSYFPLSQGYLEAYNQLINYQDIEGFSGSAQAEPLRVIESYVNGIECDSK